MITIDKKKLQELKKRSKTLRPIIRIGKNGLNDNIITEIKNHLRIRRLIKIKLLQNTRENTNINDAISDVVDKCGCVLVDKIGLTFSLYK